MKITYLDAGLREVIEVVDYPECPTYDTAVIHRAKEFAGNFDAKITRAVPQRDPNQWILELEIPLVVRRKHTPLPGDRVRFRTKIGHHQREVMGTYYYKRYHAYLIFDDGGGEWEIQSLWQMKKM